MYGNLGNFGASATPAPTTSKAATPEEYWNSLSASQQSYLNTLLLKKHIPIMIGMLALGSIAGIVLIKKGLIKI